MPNICVDGCEVSIIALPPCVLTQVSDTVAAGAQNLLKSEGKLALLAADFEEWIKNYQSPYLTAPFLVPGKVQGRHIELMGTSTSTLVNGEAVILQTTTGIMTLSVTEPAKMPPPVSSPDPVPIYLAELTITQPGQSPYGSL